MADEEGALERCLSLPSQGSASSCLWAPGPRGLLGPHREGDSHRTERAPERTLSAAPRRRQQGGQGQGRRPVREVLV